MACQTKVSRPRFGLVLSLAVLGLAGCFSFESGNMIHFKWGLRSGTSTIKRHATHDLVRFSPGRTDRERGKAAATILRTALRDVQMPNFFRVRWTAATASDQYQDIGEDIRALKRSSRCLAMRMKAGWGSWGYSWFTYNFGANGCTWGRDPVPASP